MEEIYTGLIKNDDLDILDYCKEIVINDFRDCTINNEYSVVEFEFISNLTKPNIIDLLLETYGFIFVHEVGSACFNMLNKDKSILESIYFWTGGIKTGIADLLHYEEKYTILKEVEKTSPGVGKIMVKFDEEWIDIDDDEGILDESLTTYKKGTGLEQTLYWPTLISQFTKSYIAMKNESNKFISDDDFRTINMYHNWDNDWDYEDDFLR